LRRERACAGEELVWEAIVAAFGAGEPDRYDVGEHASAQHRAFYDMTLAIYRNDGLGA
jgi:hypothetical protein